jgi:hypothetical protein
MTQLCNIHPEEHYIVMPIVELQLQTIIEVSLTNMMWTKRSQTQKNTFLFDSTFTKNIGGIRHWHFIW